MPPRLGLSTRSLQHRAPQFFNASRTTSPPPGSLTSSLPAHPSEISRPITKNELLYAPHMAVPGWAGVGGKTPLRVEGLLKDTPPDQRRRGSTPAATFSPAACCPAPHASHHHLPDYIPISSPVGLPLHQRVRARTALFTGVFLVPRQCLAASPSV